MWIWDQRQAVIPAQCPVKARQIISIQIFRVNRASLAMLSSQFWVISCECKGKECIYFYKPKQHTGRFRHADEIMAGSYPGVPNISLNHFGDDTFIQRDWKKKLKQSSVKFITGQVQTLKLWATTRIDNNSFIILLTCQTHALVRQSLSQFLLRKLLPFTPFSPHVIKRVICDQVKNMWRGTSVCYALKLHVWTLENTL